MTERNADGSIKFTRRQDRDDWMGTVEGILQMHRKDLDSLRDEMADVRDLALLALSRGPHKARRHAKKLDGKKAASA